MQTIDLKTMTTTELKATAYDQLVVARNAQQAADLINAEIELRGKTAIPEVEAKTGTCQCEECKIRAHFSDCAVHNEPAEAKGECTCQSSSSESAS